MPSPIAHCKQSVVLLVVSLFLLDCVVPSSVGSTVDIRRQKVKKMIYQSTAQQKRGGGTRLDYVPAPAPARVVADSHSQEWNQSPLNHRSTI